MVVQIKVLKGFNGPTNDEHNTLSLLVKSNYKLIDHVSYAKEKLLIALTKIIDRYNLEIYFYHKLHVPWFGVHYYLSTKWYKLIDPKLDLEDSSKELISMGYSEFKSHFINFIIIKDGTTLKISNDEFTKISNIIMNESIKINTMNNNKVTLFIDDAKDVQFEKASNKKSLFVDEDDEDNFEMAFNNIRKRNSQLKKQIKIINDKYLTVLKKYLDYLTL